MHWLYIVLTGVLVTLHQHHQAECSGVFELRLKSFDNENGKDNFGNCCAGKTGINSECRGSCRTRFRVCLKHYQTQIDESPCTFGDVLTPVLGGNSVNMLESRQEGFVNPIRFPFDFTWPRWFSLIVEAWHDSNETSRSKVLITRLSIQRSLDISDKWTEEKHQSSYSVMRYEFRVTCDEHYYGPGCENLCRPRDDNFGHYTCSPTGSRVCLPGWQDDYCNKPRCLPGCDEQHGHCNKPNECICYSGWVGPLCNECERYPGCMHGTCVKSWDCLCNEGWGGLFCNQDLNYCTNHKPCKNGGTCFNTGQGSYTCSCPPGYTGNDCERAINECASEPCLNGGTCISTIGSNNSIGGHRCDCPKNWHGINCEIAAPSCDDEPCQNGGTCVLDASFGGYRCDCAAGYSASDCSRRVDGCKPNPCLNGGICSERTDNGRIYTCTCPLGFTGIHCETNVDECASNPCLNDGSCIDLVNGYRCQCVPGYVGHLCQETVDYCLTKPCANGGTCHRLTNNFTCACRPGFTGRDCSIDIDECESSPCLNGGTCVNRVNDYECRCAADYRGRTCEDRIAAGDVSARVSSESTGLTTEHVVVIATLSTFVPLLVLIAAVVVMCLKQRRKREQARADEEARMQNEQNTVHSSMAKRGPNTIGPETHVIKNSWGKCTNNVLGSGLTDDSACVSSNTGSVGDNECFSKATHHQIIIDSRQPVYTLQRTRSHKHLNTETAVQRASTIFTSKLHEPDFDNLCPTSRTVASIAPTSTGPQDKRLSVLSNASSLCNTSDTSLVKRPLDKDPIDVLSAAGNPTGGVYVIEEHFHRPEAIHPGMFATEV